MSEGLRAAHELRDRRTVETERKVYSGATGILGYSHMKTAVGTPADADYDLPPPLGWYVIDSTGLKVWYRVAAGVWRGVAIA